MPSRGIGTYKPQAGADEPPAGESESISLDQGLRGSTWIDQGNFSASSGPKAAFSGGDLVFHIRMPKGTAAVHMDTVTQAIGEHEIVLGRHTTYYVWEVEYVGHTYHVYLEALPAEFQQQRSPLQGPVS